MKFADLELNPRLLQNLSKQGFATATKAQQEGMPVAFAGEDLLMSADTGSGKTLAFMVPAVQKLLTSKPTGYSARCLVLTPTRELAHQVLSLTNKLVKGTRLQVALILGGEDYKFQTALLRKTPDIIIATPGRFMEHQRKGHTDTEHLEILIVDEADRMLELGFCEDVESIAAAANTERQTLFYSATLRNTKVLNMANSLLKRPQEVTLNDASQIQDNIQQQVVICDDIEHKKRVLVWLLANQRANKRLIFVNSRKLSEELAQFLQSHSHQAIALHGDLPQEERNQITRQYRQHHFNLLVATEVAARGLDIEGIDQVINFDMARNLDDYLHRVGRTGRAGKQGLAINLVNISERQLLTNVEAAQGSPLSRLNIKGLAAKLHRDNDIKGRQSSASMAATKGKPKTRNTNKPKQHKSSPTDQRKPTAAAKTARAKAANIWGDGSAPFGMKKP
ncbi:MAG: DEAD/DEAH box helicase [Gammaproteobacteria bacterium]|jgi:superfamily II DNA/RNA helicase|nr:DEAD/DEAH box helicase [Gammaproteobacteria bacterium]